MKILIVYNSLQTYTNTVFEHLDAFSKYSKYENYFIDQERFNTTQVDLANFDVLVVHFSTRVAYNQISGLASDNIKLFKGVKALFLQDEYDHTHRTHRWIRTLDFQLVFTVVPQQYLETVYPQREFDGVRFVSVLTGYVPESLMRQRSSYLPPSKRKVVVGYRGRPLPIRYGMLGLEKVRIGELFKSYCERKNIQHDISWTEEARIYGPNWYRFMASCKSMLGSESGSNVFDWRGDMDDLIAIYRSNHPECDDRQIYDVLIKPNELDGVMNQISPKIFEAIAARTVLVLYDGRYSGIIEKDRHFIAVKKDGSNIDEVFDRLSDDAFVDRMTEQTFKDVISSGRYTYRSFLEIFDGEIEQCYENLILRQSFGSQLVETALNGDLIRRIGISAGPIRARPHNAFSTKRLIFMVWALVPEGIRVRLRPVIRKVLRLG